MPNDDDPAITSPATKPPNGTLKPLQQPPASPPKGSGSIFALPRPLKRIFDSVPLVVYEANDLPIRASQPRHQHVLYVFTTPSDARAGAPSFNPSCLKWQTYLKFTGLDFRLLASSNHASPSGALPFLQPALIAGSDAKVPAPVPSSRLKKWLAGRQDTEEVLETSDTRYEAYSSLLEERIRKAWLYQLYINPANMSVVDDLYVKPCSSNPFVGLTVRYQLRQAATRQLTSSTETIVEADLMQGADEALSALSHLLSDNDWFFGQAKPGLLDASVFAYTYLILDNDAMGWIENRLATMLRSYSNLVQHQRRIAALYY